MDQRRRIRWVKRGIKLAVGALILGMVARHLARSWADLRSYGRALEPDPLGLVLAAGLYLLGLSAFGLFFWRIFGKGRSRVGLPVALRAYLIGHLGKYVPGKAMVVVLRVGLVVPYGARASTAAFATLYETLVMMASGGLIAAALFATGPGGTVPLPWPEFLGGGRLDAPLALLSLAIGAPLTALALPGIFPRLALTASLPFPGVGPEALPDFSRRLLAEGLALAVVGWTGAGLSLVAVLAAIDPHGGLSVARWPLAIASVALATVAGFLVAIFPGGLVIREAVLTAALGPLIGAEPALAAAVALRLVWVAAELASSGLVAACRPRKPAISGTEPRLNVGPAAQEAGPSNAPPLADPPSPETSRAPR